MNSRENSPFSLAGKKILITGASSGIGRCCAIELSKLGASTILVARNDRSLLTTHQMLTGGNHSIEVYDLTCGEELVGWLKEVANRNGLIDGLIHSAGITKTMPIRATNQELYRQIMSINLESSYFLSKAFRQRGVCNHPASIVLMSSIAGIVGQAGLSAYCASKGALLTLAKSLAIELAPEGIRVNAIAPGLISTPLVTAEASTVPTRTLETVIARHPLGIGTPEDVAYAAAYLVSNAARWVTGTTLIVDGGYTAI
jgi:NAD(P)-dependent dehydrogenase (short-subunit alcohol dehydrogenase family)